MIFEISCSILKKKKSFNFHFFKNSNFWVFLFLAKNTPKFKKCSKNGQNHQFTLLSFTFNKKNPLFDVDLFSRTFDMKLPCHQNIVDIWQ